MGKSRAKTVVVNVRTDPYDVYIGRAVNRAKDARCHRASVWANPFKPGADGRRACIDRYRAYIAERLEAEPALRAELKKLRGKRLGCWCTPEPCHGDVLAELADGMGD